MANIKQLQLGSTTYEFNGKYIQDKDGNAKTWEDITSLITAASLPLKVVTELPIASATTMGAIYLVAHSHGSGDTYDEYITLQDSTTKAYSWEKIGNTDVDLTDYLKKGTTYTGAAQSNGAHTHTVTGTVNVPTVTDTHKYLTATASGTDLNTSTTAVLTGVKASSTGSFVKGDATYTVSGGQLTGATAASKTADTFSQGSLPSLGDGFYTAGTQGSAASWSAQVSNAGVLSFSFTANTPSTPTKVDTTKFSAGSLPTFTEGKFIPNTVGSVSSISVAVATGGTASAVTGVAGDGTANAITSASVKTQPTITLTTGSTTSAGAIDYVSDVSTSTQSVSIANGSAASAGAHTHDVNVASTES